MMFESLDYVWIPEKYNDEICTICFKDIDASQLEVAEWAEAVENILEYMGKLDTDAPGKYLSLRYTMACRSIDDSGVGVSYEIERGANRLTIAQSPEYLMAEPFEFNDFDEFCEEYGVECDESDFRYASEIFVVDGEVYFDQEPGYDSIADLRHFIKSKG